MWQNFETWSPVINNVLKFSTLDHLYCKDPTFLEDIAIINPVFGDHVVITFKVRFNVVVEEKTMRRDWRHYSLGAEIVETTLFVSRFRFLSYLFLGVQIFGITGDVLLYLYGLNMVSQKDVLLRRTNIKK